MATLAGSHLYGTNTELSDIDIRGVCFSPVTSLLGLSKFEQYQPRKDEAIKYSKEQFNIECDDLIIYSIGKFFKLLLAANPNIIELLFCAPIYQNETWECIIENRDLFLSQKIIHTFSGYAYSQLKRIESHKKWLENLPEKPDPYLFGMINKKDGGQEWKSSILQNTYKNKSKNYQNYITWRKNRNLKRAKLEEKYGYDTKHAMHLYRLIGEAQELLETGHLELPLKCYNQCFDILHGKMSYDEIIDLGNKAHSFLKSIKTDLPKKPKSNEAEKLLVKLQLGNL